MQFNSGDFLERKKQVFERLKEIAPKLADQYLNRGKTIQSEYEIKKDITLTDVQDSNHFFLPLSKNCELKQITARKAFSLSNEPRFLIDSTLWDKLDETN